MNEADLSSTQNRPGDASYTNHQAAGPRAADSRATDPRIDMDAKLAAEIEDALSDMSLEDILDLQEQPKQARSSSGGRGQGTQRQVKTGTIMSVHGSDVFVEFGPKSQGVCPLSMFEAPPALGEKMEFIVDRY